MPLNERDPRRLIMDHGTPIQIDYDPDSQENIVQRAGRLKKIIRQLDKTKIIPQRVLLRRFEV